MPYGTANARLRKKLMFHLLERLGETSCFRCGGEMTEETLSIEHKEPWLHVSLDLFWELDNVTFSHVRCNISAARKNRSEYCPQGHPMSGDNLRVVKTDGSRQCRECSRIRWHRLGLAEKRRKRRNGINDPVSSKGKTADC